MSFTSKELMFAFKLEPQQLVIAYAYDGEERILIHRGKEVRAKSLTITFEQTEHNPGGRYRLASGEEINWWSNICDDVPTDKMVICSDGMYMWKVEGAWDSEEGYDITGMGYVKVEKH